ncbi:hypothetical protein ACLKA6_009576, partial [Drosophila palustris]
RRQSPSCPRSPAVPEQSLQSRPHPIRTSLTSLVQHNKVSVLPTALVTLEVGVRRYDIRIATSLATAYGLSVTREGPEGF